MAIQIATKLILQAGTVAIPRVVDMQGANAVELGFEIISADSTPTIDVYADQSNDLQNWSPVAEVFNVMGLGYTPTQVTLVTGQYLRLSLDLVAATTAVVAIDAEPKEL